MMRQWKVVLAVLLVLMLALTACGQPAQEAKTETGAQTTEKAAETTQEPIPGGTLASIKEKGKLVVGTSADYPPYEFHTLIDGKDEIVGFDMALAKYIAEELGVELEIADMAFESLLIGLETGKFDMVIAAMNPDPERNANFSEIYYTATHGIVTTKDKLDSYTTVEELAGKKLGVQIGTVQEGIGEELEGVELQALPLITNLMLELTTGKIDGIIMEVPVAESYAKVNTDLAIVQGIEWGDESEGSAIALKKGDDELTQEVNRILEKVKVENLMEQWVIEANELNEQGQ